MGAAGLGRVEWLHELLLELKAQLGLRGWGAASWLFPGSVTLPWSMQPAVSPCSWYRSQPGCRRAHPRLHYSTSARGSWGASWPRWAKVTLVQCCGRDCYLWISPLVSWSQISEVTDIDGFVPDLGRRLESRSRTSEMCCWLFASGGWSGCATGDPCCCVCAPFVGVCSLLKPIVCVLAKNVIGNEEG